LRASITTRVCDALGDGAGLLIPTAPCIALRIDAGADEIGAFYRNALALTSIAGHAGIPQISLPVTCVEGCPVGLSVLASPGHDRALFDLGVRYADAIGTA
jgi:amidase